MLENIRKNRELKVQVERLETQLNEINISLARDIGKLRAEEVRLSEETAQFCIKNAELIERSERVHRFEQVSGMIAQKILALL